MGYRSLEEALMFGHELNRDYVCQAHKDHSASASVNAVNGFFFCHACGNSGRVDLDKIEITSEGLTKYVTKMLNAEDPRDRFTESWLNTFDQSPSPYWMGRFNAATCAFYRLGESFGVPVYPMRDNDGGVLGVVRRNLDPEGAKYLYPYGVKTSERLIDLHRVESDTIIMVEGMTDVAAVYEAGYHVALGCYKARVSKAQVALLRRYDPKKILVGFDQDEAGNKGYELLKSLLGSEYRIERIQWSHVKDLAEIPLVYRRRMLDQILDNESVTRVEEPLSV